MQPTGTVLIYGHDPLLLQTRRRILEQAGYTAWAAEVLDEVESIITTNAVGLLIVCQTLSDEEGEAAITLAHQIRPEMKTLVMSLTRQRLLKTAQETPFNVSTGPRNLLDTVQKLMGKPRENTSPKRQGDNSMAAEHKDIEILAADPSGKNIIIHFSDGTTTLFQTHFLYEVRDQDGNVALTDMGEDELMKGFDDYTH